jgi:hypothetical protein
MDRCRTTAGMAMLGAATLVMLHQVAAQPAAPVGQKIQPTFSLWDAKPGMSLSDVPEIEIVETACGTNGGPPSVPLQNLADYMACPPEPSGLREIHFAYDDEQDYIARAFDAEYDVVQGGTSIYAYHEIISMLVDETGVIQGIRAVTDPDVDVVERRRSVELRANLKARFAGFGIECVAIPARPGEQPVGNTFIHERCTGTDPGSGQHVLIEASYLRKSGQEGLNRETQQVNQGYFESQVRLELLSTGYDFSALSS